MTISTARLFWTQFALLLSVVAISLAAVVYFAGRPTGALSPWWIAGAGFAAVIAAALRSAWRNSRALRRLTETALAAAAGSHDRRAEHTVPMALAPLARALDGLAKELEHRIDTMTAERNQLLTVLGGMLEGVVAVDREERVLHMNPVAGAIFQAHTTQAVGRRVWEVIRVHEFCKLLTDTVREGKPSTGEIRLLQRGLDHWVGVLTSPLHDGDGRLSGAVAVLQDMTRLRRLEAMRRDFVANVSHELKTPITAIRGFAEALSEEPDMPAHTRHRFLDKIHTQVLRLSSIVTDLLTLSRLESSVGALEGEPVELRQLLISCMHGVVPPGDEGPVTASFEGGQDPCFVAGDDQMLRMLFNNLLDNARKYTQKGSIRVRLTTTGDHAVVEIQDTGIGIDAEHLDRIFERFYRVDKARSRELGGTGLGLSIVKHICLAHHGEVSVESTPGAGSTFRVVLPLELSGAPRD